MRGLISAAVVAVAVVIQLAVADRIAFPGWAGGGAGPDLVLLTVAALALATGPMVGTLTGFCAGLALDVAPPAGHLVGQDALVFCLVGYACGLFATGSGADGTPEPEHSALFEIGVTAAGAVCGEAMVAALGVMLSDPRVTWAAVKHVLPAAIGYDLLLSPFVLFAAAAMLRLAGAAGAAGRSGVSLDRAASSAAARRPTWAGQAPGTVRQLAGGTPKLRLSGSGGTGAGLGLSSAHGVRRGPSTPSFTKGGSNPWRKGEGNSRLGASLLGGSVFGRSGPHFGRSSSLTGHHIKQSLAGKGKILLGAGPHQPRFHKPGALSRLAHVLRRPVRSRSPGKRWLRGGASGRGRIAGISRGTGIPRGTNRIKMRRNRKISGIPGIGSRRSRRPARLRMRSAKSMKPRNRIKPGKLGKTWRRPGGYR